MKQIQDFSQNADIKETTNFIDEIFQGTATIDELDHKVGFWHTHQTNNSLQDFLGLSDQEYDLWMKSSNDIFNVFIYCRKNDISI